MTETSDPKPGKPEEHPDPRLLEFLVCPVTKGPLDYDASTRELISRRARLAYPIRSGVPLMTAEAARSLDTDPAPEPSPAPDRTQS
jgi:uncharacterized protein YbaR (Trm112 family)